MMPRLEHSMIISRRKSTTRGTGPNSVMPRIPSSPLITGLPLTRMRRSYLTMAPTRRRRINTQQALNARCTLHRFAAVTVRHSCEFTHRPGRDPRTGGAGVEEKIERPLAVNAHRHDDPLGGSRPCGRDEGQCSGRRNSRRGSTECTPQASRSTQRHPGAEGVHVPTQRPGNFHVRPPSQRPPLGSPPHPPQPAIPLIAGTTPIVAAPCTRREACNRPFIAGPWAVR